MIREAWAMLLAPILFPSPGSRGVKTRKGKAVLSSGLLTSNIGKILVFLYFASPDYPLWAIDGVRRLYSKIKTEGSIIPCIFQRWGKEEEGEDSVQSLSLCFPRLPQPASSQAFVLLQPAFIFGKIKQNKC